MSCLSFNTAPVCVLDADGAKTGGVAHYTYDADGVLVRTVITDGEGAPVDTTGLTVTAGACPVFQPDVEWEQLGDVLGDGSTVCYMCRVITSFDEACLPIDPPEVATFELDKVTPYVPVGTPGPCDTTCPDVEPVGVVSTWDAL